MTVSTAWTTILWMALAATGAVLGLTGCDKPAPTKPPPPAAAPAATASAATSASAAIDAAIASTQRLSGDADEDAWRKPKDVLMFLGAKPGMHVLDYFSAGGYYTELLSRIVGEQGAVIAYNNAAYLKFAQDRPAQRYGANRLPNVAQLTTPPAELPLEPASLDAALFVMSYHDLYWQQQDPAWGVIDPAQALAKLVAALKPGGVVVVVDHAAQAGGDTPTVVGALHRIDPAVVRRDFAAAGLVFDGESTVLRHTGDDHTRPVFDPAVQHQTDQFIYRFRKPA